MYVKILDTSATGKSLVEAKSSGSLTSEQVRSLFQEEKADGTLGPVSSSRASAILNLFADALGGARKPGLLSIPDAKDLILSEQEFINLLKPQNTVLEGRLVQDKAKSEDLETPLKFPGLPTERKALEGYQTPAWYKRMEAALNAGKHVSLAGPPGIGKSTGPEQYFVRKGQPFVIVNGDAGFRRRDIEGTTEITNGTTYFKVAEFAAAAINGWGCILNEVNAADPDALLWINGILEEKIITVHGKAYPVHPDFKLVVTYNPGLIGTKPLPQAFKDRFFPVKLAFPPRNFLKRILVAKTGISDSAPYLEKVLKYADDCWKLHEKGNLRYQISPRRLFDVIFLLEEGIASDFEEAVKQAVVDAVDSAADAQMLVKLITSPLAEVGPVSQFA
jgi:nitric oxide reductase NorQ protein